MKKTAAISLLFLLLASQFGHHILFSVQDWGIRQEQERRILSSIPEAYLERVEDGPELVWEEEGKEFLHAGEMYDVVRTRTEHGKTIHYAIPDAKESELVRTFSKILKSDTNVPQTDGGGKTSLKLQIPVFTLPEMPVAMARDLVISVQVPNNASRTISRPRSVLPCPPWA